jgi:hypothetical protein
VAWPGPPALLVPGWGIRSGSKLGATWIAFSQRLCPAPGVTDLSLSLPSSTVQYPPGSGTPASATNKGGRAGQAAGTDQGTQRTPTVALHALVRLPHAPAPPRSGGRGRARRANARTELVKVTVASATGRQPAVAFFAWGELGR